MMPFVADLRWRSCRHEVVVPDWVPDHEVIRLSVMVDPPQAPHGWEHAYWGGHAWYFRVPFGQVQPVGMWSSDSPGSGAHYPYWITMADHYSNMVGSIVLQIMPENSVTSSHYHPQGRHGEVAEDFVPLFADGETKLLRHGHMPVRLHSGTGSRPCQRERVAFDCKHQLVRQGIGLSVQLLRTYGAKPFPCRDDHIPCESLLYEQLV